MRGHSLLSVSQVFFQPIPDNEIWNKEYERLRKVIEDDSDVGEYHRKHLKSMFIETTHVKFLESAGARVVPIDYTDSEEAIISELEQINGLYIPGDSKDLITYMGFDEKNYQYTKTIQRILLWAQNHNMK